MSEAYQIIEKKETQRWPPLWRSTGRRFFLWCRWWSSQLAVEDLMDGPGGPGGRAFAVGHLMWRGPPARQPGGPGDPEGAQAEGEKAAARRRGQGRPAYAHAGRPRAERMQARGLDAEHAAVLPELAETVGVSKIEAAEAELRRLCERRFDDIPHPLPGRSALRRAAWPLGWTHGAKSTLGLRERHGVTALLVGGARRAARAASAFRHRRQVGDDNPVQRCRNHKVKN